MESGGNYVKRLLGLICLGFLLAFLRAEAATVGEGRVVTRERFNKVVKVLVDTVKRQKDLEEQMIVMQDKLRQVQAGGTRGGGGEPSGGGLSDIPSKDDSSVDLAALDESGGAGATPASSGASAYGKGGGAPHINIYFDFYLMSQPGGRNANSGGNTQGTGLTFNNIHHFFLVEATAGPDIKFMTEIQGNPRFYELDYQFTKWFQLRLGKIWIPFDDLVPHNQFGGHMNVSRLRPVNTNSTGTGSTNYLPDLWAELGVAGKFNLVEREKFELELHTFIVNGFGAGGVDPVTPAGGLQYPSFADPTIETTDNNREKSLGGRVHALIGHTVGLGMSYYTGRYSDKDKPKRKLSIYGSDVQLYFNRLEFRFGYMNFDVELAPGASTRNYNRPGYYAEASYKLGAKRQWKLLAATGAVNGDNRIVDVNDRQITGGKLLYRPNNIEWGIEHFRDFKKIAEKDYRSFTAFRVIAMF